MIRKILLTGVFVLLAVSAFGEYYQYTDENGNAAFTDDLYQVPEAQRSATKKFESETTNVSDETATEVSSESEELEETDATAETAAEPESGETTSSNIANDKAEGDSQMSAVELSKIQLELNETRKALDDEKAALEAQTPKGRAPSKRIEHSAKVDALNAKIVKYGEDLKAFEDKATEFNSQNQKVAE